MICPKCGKPAAKNGSTRNGKQKYICRHCNHNFERPKEGEIIEPIPEEKTIGLPRRNCAQCMTSGLLWPQNARS